MFRTFRVPAALTVASLVGLVAALVWDDARETVAVGAAATPLAALAWACLRQRG